MECEHNQINQAIRYESRRGMNEEITNRISNLSESCKYWESKLRVADIQLQCSKSLLKLAQEELDEQ